MGKKRLIWHLYPVFLIIIVVVLLAVVLYTSHFFRTLYYNEVANDLRIRAQIIEYQIEPMLKSGGFSEIDNVCKSLGKAGASRITIILPDGQVIGDSDENPEKMKNHSDRPEFKTAIKGDLGKSVRFSDTLGKNMMYLAIPIKQDGKILAVIRTSVSLTIIEQELISLYKKIFWTSIIIAICAAAVSLAISKKISRPIEQMTKAAQLFASGRNQRLPIPDSAELAQLAKVLNEMEQVRRDFVANVSHELKTPITSIKGFVETLLDGTIEDPVQARRFLEIIAKHSDRLNAIINDLLALSRLEEEDEKRKLSFEEQPLKPVLASAIELSKVKTEEKQIKIELNCDEKITAKINSALIEQAIINLVDNAVKYSPENSTIIVNAQKTLNEIVITVIDRGCGIEKEHLPRIFERFYVVDKARSRKLGGTGLGLSIVKHISDVHGGFVTVESKVNQGSTFSIHLPTA